MSGRFNTIRQRYTVILLVFVLVAAAITVVGIQQFIKPKLRMTEEHLITLSASKKVIDKIEKTLTGVEAQQKAITQTVPLLPDNQIEASLPNLVDQYGDPLVFGGGIWPLPNKRVDGVDRTSAFFHRNASGGLVANSYWNSDEAPDYFTQPWHRAGQTAPKGHCAWAKAYKDGASTEARTNCAMAIHKNGSLWGVSTIDVTLGFFSKLIEEQERNLQASMLIVEGDGKIVSDSNMLPSGQLLKNVSEQNSPFAKAVSQLLRSSEKVSEFEADGETYFVETIKLENTPWHLAVAQNTTLLNKNTSEVLGALFKVQLPIALFLLLSFLIALQKLASRLLILQESVDTLSSGNGDLTLRLPSSHREDELDQIAISTNKFIAHLQKLFKEVAEANEICSSEARAILDDASQTMGILDDHVKETDGVVTAIEELSATSTEVATHASDTASSTQVAQQQAEASMGKASTATNTVEALLNEVSNASERVQDMESYADQIVSVLNVIRDIADQTNLLALNAAIEAARAGEQGRGFAVVADEVRGLAAKTQASTAKVDEMLNQLSNGVASAVQAMGDTQQRCGEVSSNTEEVHGGINLMAEETDKINQLTVQIATAAEEQKQVTDEINRNMSTIREIIEQLHHRGENSVESAQRLDSSNERMKAVIGQFTL